MLPSKARGEHPVLLQSSGTDSVALTTLSIDDDIATRVEQEVRRSSDSFKERSTACCVSG
jgi:hypothetical protein